MASVRLKAPEGATSASFEGEDIPIIEGHVVVSEKVARILHSHGYTSAVPEVHPAPAAKVVEPDDAPADGETDEPLDPDSMNKDELKAFLSGEGVSIPKGSSVGALRALVRSHLETKNEKE